MEYYKKKTVEIIEKTSVKKDEVFEYDKSPLKEEFDQIFNFYQKNLQVNSKYGIEPAVIFFNNNRTVNAKAGKDSDYYIISMNMGTVVTLWNMFQEKEDLISDDTIKDFYEFEKLLDLYINNLMYQMAIHFTFYHEMGHLIQKSDLLENNIYEHLDIKNVYLEAKHLLELDADEFSSLAVGAHIIQYAEKMFGKEITKDQFQKLLIITCSSIFLYLLSFKSYQRNLYFKEFSHPHPTIRIMMIITTIVRYCTETLEAKNIKLNLISKEIVDESLIFTKIIANKFFKSDIVTKYIETIQENREKIMEYLIYFQELKTNNETLACHKWNLNAENIKEKSKNKENDTPSNKVKSDNGS